MPSNHLILCHPVLLLPSVFPSIGIFSNESALPIRWPKYCNFRFSICPSSDYSGLICFRIDVVGAFDLEMESVLLPFESGLANGTVSDVTHSQVHEKALVNWNPGLYVNKPMLGSQRVRGHLEKKQNGPAENWPAFC